MRSPLILGTTTIGVHQSVALVTGMIMFCDCKSQVQLEAYHDKLTGFALSVKIDLEFFAFHAVNITIRYSREFPNQ